MSFKIKITLFFFSILIISIISLVSFKSYKLVKQKNDKLNNMIGYNFRMGEIEAAIGLTQYKKLKKIIISRNTNTVKHLLLVTKSQCSIFIKKLIQIPNYWK